MSFLAIVLLLAAGCQKASSLKKEVEVISVEYNCKELGNVKVDFFPFEDKATMLINETTHNLKPQVQGSGFRYSNEHYTIFGKGYDLWVEPNGKDLVECKIISKSEK